MPYVEMTSGTRTISAGRTTEFAMSPMPAPSADRRRLRTILRREREGVHMTQDQVAIAMDWSLSKVIRIESGSVSISTNDLRALLDLYQVSVPAQREELIGLARAA